MLLVSEIADQICITPSSNTNFVLFNFIFSADESLRTFVSLSDCRPAAQCARQSRHSLRVNALFGSKKEGGEEVRSSILLLVEAVLSSYSIGRTQ